MATDYVKEKHDIGITSGSKVVPFMLAEKKGIPQYQTYDDEYLASQQYTTPGYSALPPEKEIAIRQTSWRAGMGQRVYDSTVSERFYKSTNCDARFKGMVIQGPKSTAYTKPVNPSAPTPANANMELDSDWILATWGSRSNTFAHGGTYSWRVETKDGNDREAYQDITCYPNLEYTVTIWAYRDLSGGTVPDSIKIGINDGKTTTYSSVLSANDTWTQLSVTKTLSPEATRCRILLFATEAGANSKYGYFDDAAVTITSSLTVGVSKAFADFNDNRYRSFGNVLAKLDTGAGDSYDFVRLFEAPIEGLTVGPDGFLYVCLGGDTVLEDCEDAWDEAAVGNVTTTVDTGDYKVGSGSVKVVVEAAKATGLLCSEVVSLDLSGYTGVQMWIKSSVALTSGDLQLLLDDTADCASPLETLDIQTVLANEWTRVYMGLANPETDTTIISMGLNMAVDKGAFTVKIDDVKVAAPYYYMDSGENFTQVGAGDLPEDRFALGMIVNGTTMWKRLEPNKLHSATDATDPTTWSTATSVDDHTINITDFLSWENSVYIMKEDRPFYLTSGGAVEVLIDDTKSIQTSYSGKNSVVWHDALYMPWGVNSLVAYTTTSTWIDPSLYITDDADYVGRVFAGVGDNMWYYIAVDNGSKIEILAGRNETIDSSTQWVWQPIHELTLTGCENLSISTVYQKRLEIASTLAGDSFYYLPLYENYTNPTADSNRQFDTSATTAFITSWLHGEFRGDNKGFIKITLEMKDTTANVYWECHYQKYGDEKSGGVGWTDIGDFKTSPTTSASIPIDGSSNNPVSTMMRFKFVPKTNSATATPVLLGFDVRAILYPSRREIIMCTVRVADNIVDKYNHEYHETAAHLATVLEAAADATWPVTINDIHGTSKTVKFLPMGSEVTRDEKSRNIERHFHLKMQTVALS